jgi:hypothetical protein
MSRKKQTAPSDYSRWDKINDSSDEEVNTLSHLRIAQPSIVTEDVTTTTHFVPSALKPMIVGTNFLCEKDRKGGSFFQRIEISPSHPVLQYGVKSPVSVLINIPLLTYRYNSKDGIDGISGSEYDNQRITYLMIDSRSGFADLMWQQDIGTALVVREDRQPFDERHAEVIFQYFKHLLSNYDFTPGCKVYNLMNRNGFARFFDKWCNSSKRSILSLKDFYIKKPMIAPKDHNIITVDGFLFPVDDESPRLISIDCEMRKNEEDETTYHYSLLDQWFGNEIKATAYIQQLPSMNVKLISAYEIVMLDSFHNAKLNLSLRNTHFKWRGNIVVMKMKGLHFSEESFNFYQNIGTNELPLLQEYFIQYRL